MARTLVQSGTAVDLTGLTVQFRMEAADGTQVQDWTATGVTVVSAANGQVQYDFAAANVATAGVYYGWFRVGDGSEWDTFPPFDRGPRAQRIVIS